MYSTEYILNNIVINLHREKWLLAIVVNHFVSYINVELLCYRPETNTILYVNYSLIKMCLNIQK